MNTPGHRHSSPPTKHTDQTKKKRATTFTVRRTDTPLQTRHTRAYLLDLQRKLESIAAGSNTGAALVAMSRWAEHRSLLPSPSASGAGGPEAGAGAGGAESVSPLFDSAALPTVFERLLLLATATTTTTAAAAAAAARAGDGPLCPADESQQEREWAGETGGRVGGGDGNGDGDGDGMLDEAKAGLDDLLRVALPNLVGVVSRAAR